MGSLALLVLLVGAFIVYEAVKALEPANAAASSTPTAPTKPTAPTAPTSPSNITLPGPSSTLIPQPWLVALAAHESPSALRGDFSYGAFGLSCGAGQGYAVGCTPPLPSQDPQQGTTPPLDIFPNWGTAVNGLTAWVQRNAPEAFGAQSCAEFMAILQAHRYGNLAGTC